MGKLKDFLKKAAKPAVMASVAGSVALSLVVTTPSNAEAFVGAIPALPAVFGRTAMAIPELVPVASILGPVGWGLAGVAAVAMIGVALYETRDTWVPWVQGAFGAAAGALENPPTPGMGASVYAGLDLTTFSTASNARYFNANMTYNGTADYWNGALMGVAGYFQCKRPNGTTYTRTDGQLGSFGSRPPGQIYSKNAGVQFDACGSLAADAGAVVVGALVGPASGEARLPAKVACGTGCWAAYPGPDSVKSWGTLAPDPGFNPRGSDVKYKTTVECVDPVGGKSSITADWTGDSPGMVIPSCDKAGKGHGTGKITVDGFAPGTTTPTRVWDNPAPADVPGREACNPQRPQKGCELKVLIDGKPCVVGLWDCENWQDVNKADPNKDGTNPRVSCQYGPYSVPLNTCNPLERAYEPDGAPVNDANTDGNPATRSNTNLDSSPNPTPDAAKPAAVPGGPVLAPPAGSTPEQSQCFPQGWAQLNPIEWVMKPVGCALDSAFKPKKDIQTRINGMGTQFAGKVPMSWFGVGVQGVSGGACPTNWAIDYKGQHYSLICGTPAEQIMRNFRPALGAMLTIAMIWPLLRSLFYAAIPIFKVNPS